MRNVILAAFLLASATPANARTVKILTYNIGGIPDILFPLPRREGRVAKIADILARRKYDVVCLQEVWLQKDANYISRKADYPYSARLRINSTLTALFGNGLLILSRFPIVEARFFPYSINAPVFSLLDADFWATKGLLAVRLKLNGKEIDVYTTHMTASTDDRRHSSIRKIQTMELIDSVYLFSRGGPFVITGDFNSKIGWPEYTMLTSTLRLRDTCMRDGANSCGVTDPLDHKLDFIFLSDHFPQDALKNARIDFRWSRPYPFMELSDHQAIGVTFECCGNVKMDRRR